MRNFSIGIIIRIMLIVVWAMVAAWCYAQGNFFLMVLMLLLIVSSAFNLFTYTTALNNKLSRIFDSIQYEDFAITFRADNGKGESFKELNQSLNAVIKSFNQVRAEREATLHFIQAIIQQINVGIISYNTEGKTELINQAANKLLGIYKLSHISAIKSQHPDLYQYMTTLPSGESKLIKLKTHEISLSVKEIILRDRKIRLIAMHNIRSELQTRELDAWQNLTKVLRHEIMNTVTPIVSLSETMYDIIVSDLKDVKEPQQAEGVKDLENAITTVINRSKGIMNFVSAYREFTNIPSPNISALKVSFIFNEISSMYKPFDVQFIVENDFVVMCDVDQIGQVLINLIKNAQEATQLVTHPKIIVRSSKLQHENIIEVIDNGTGISADDVDKIFVPFFTTKSSGTGIGLSLSRQIVMMHGGSLEYEPQWPQGSRFYITMP